MASAVAPLAGGVCLRFGPSFSVSVVTEFAKRVVKVGEVSFLGFLEKSTDTSGGELDTFREHHTVHRAENARVRYVP